MEGKTMLDEATPLGADIASYFKKISDGHLSGHQGIGLNLLSQHEALKFSRALRGHPFVETTESFVLDDAETSNHHLLITKGALAGSIFFLDHDGDSRVVFESLQSFLAAAYDAVSRQIWIEKLHPPVTPICQTPRELDVLVTSLLNSDLEDLIPSFVPSMDLQNIELLARLVDSPNFFLGEAVAQAICLRPNERLRGVAVLCSGHSHAQVAGAGRDALVALDENRQSSQ